ncbi:helix-turn-helix transcriptional regulator [Actinoplanes sp. LDG1-06]|uniref:Helix-turn-helix transcriptional regulator n=1 Tax=Paractinoplanes ovalisporus TaxID=2810368 RepID=A0ABS2AG99_9ACTN|nr:AraC family transcriptional regulator [Actinoplanes ovalisporus]MBM2618398.1 helix-turn-helix transcriptional regulator [Actinoplanes ovalisporus]
MPDGPVRSEVRTRDQNAAVEAVRRIAEHRSRIVVPDPRGVSFAVRSAQLDCWGTDDVVMAGLRYDTTMEPLSQLIAGMWRAGHGSIRSGGDEVAMGPGDGFLYPLARSVEVDNLNPAKSLVRLPAVYVADVAEELTGLPAGDLHFLGMRPMTEAKRDNWVATVAFLVDHLNDPAWAVPPLLAEQLQRLAATALLRVFPNTTMTVARVPPSGRTSPAVVRRATEFMDANAARPLTVAEIAEAAGVNPRTLQAAFRHHSAIAPLTYLRRARLERARAELRAARHGDGTTVAAVASRWGFHRPARFATAYRAAFGEPPRLGG